MLPMEGARGMPVDPYDQEGSGWMPIDPLKDDGEHGDSSVMDDGQHGDGMVDPLKDDGEHGMPVDPYDHLTLSWDPFDQEQMPIDPLDQEGMPIDPLDQEGMPIDPLGQEGMPIDPLGQEVEWRVDLIGPAGLTMSMVTTENSIPLSSFGIKAEGLMVEDQDFDSEPLAFDGVDGESQDPLMVEDQDYDSEPLAFDGVDGESSGFLSYDGVDGESQDPLMVNGQDWDSEPLFWRLTGFAPSGDGSMQPFCQSTNWLSFQLGGFRKMLSLPWTEAAPPPPAPAPSPPEPTPIVTLEAPVGCVPTFTANMNLTCRFGPASVYHELGYLLLGESATVEGRNADSTWWWIPNPDWQGYCWVWDGGGDAICIPEDLQVIAAPPPPTPTPTPLACTSDLGPDACAAAGGTYSGGATTAPVCNCP
jgi:hypothetical protein